MLERPACEALACTGTGFGTQAACAPRATLRTQARCDSDGAMTQAARSSRRRIAARPRLLEAS